MLAELLSNCNKLFIWMMLIINGIPEQQEDLSWNTKHKGFLWNNEMEFAQSNGTKKPVGQNARTTDKHKERSNFLLVWFLLLNKWIKAVERLWYCFSKLQIYSIVSSYFAFVLLTYFYPQFSPLCLQKMPIFHPLRSKQKQMHLA